MRQISRSAKKAALKMLLYVSVRIHHFQIMVPVPENRLKITASMIRINAGRSPGVINACKPLDEYTWLIDRIRCYEKTMALEAAVDAALDEMPDDFLLRPFLEANRVEVKKMLLTEYNEAKTMELFKEEGRMEGRKEGETRLSALITRLISLGRTDEIAKAASDSAYRDRLYEEFSMA